jgi:chromosome segregation ATPase
MSEMHRREEFERRVTVLEDEVEGEKTVTRFILRQSRRNGDDLVAVKRRLDRIEEQLDGLDKKVDGLERRFDGLERKVDGLDQSLSGLARNLPGIVADAMREVDRERREREDGDGK